MINLMAYWVLLAQENGAKATETPEPEAGPFGGLSGLMLPIAAVMVLYIFMMVLPARKEQQKSKDMMGSLKKNDRIITAGGIVATIANIQKDSEFVTLKIDDASNAKMKVLRSSISRVLESESETESTSSKK